MNCMFQVFERNSITYNKLNEDYEAKRVNVYNVRDNKNGYPLFLIFDNGWKWRSAKHYIPEILDFEIVMQDQV